MNNKIYQTKYNKNEENNRSNSDGFILLERELTYIEEASHEKFIYSEYFEFKVIKSSFLYDHFRLFQGINIDTKINVPIFNIEKSILKEYFYTGLIDYNIEEIEYFRNLININQKLYNLFFAFLIEYKLTDLEIIGFIKNNANLNYVRDEKYSFHFKVNDQGVDTVIVLNYDSDFGYYLYFESYEHFLKKEYFKFKEKVIRTNKNIKNF